MGTVIQYKQRSNDDYRPRWDRTQRAALLDQYDDLQAQGCSLRQAAQALPVPRSTLQAWRAYQESLDEHLAVVAFFHRCPGLAFLHRLVLGLHLVCTEVGACGIRLGCLLLQLTGLNRFVGASYGTQHQVNRQVEEAIVTYRREESARLARDRPAQAITLAKDETFTGGLCLVAMEPKSNYIILEQAAQSRDRDTGQWLDGECGRRDTATLKKMVECLAQWDMHVYYTDTWGTYASIIPQDKLGQSKATTHDLERHHCRQRHWFGRFKRRSIMVSKSLFRLSQNSRFSIFNGANRLRCFQ